MEIWEYETRYKGQISLIELEFSVKWETLKRGDITRKLQNRTCLPNINGNTGQRGNIKKGTGRDRAGYYKSGQM